MAIKLDGITIDIQDLLANVKQQANRETLRAAQRERSKQFGIQVLPGGALTIPARFARMGATLGDMADPVNIKFPIWLTKPDREALTPAQLGQVRNAPVRFSQFGGYNQASGAAVGRRIEAALKKFKVGQFAEKSFEVGIVVKENKKQLAFGIVLKADKTDLQQDHVKSNETEDAAHDFMIRSRMLDLNHQKVLPQIKAMPVESFIAPIAFKMNGKQINQGDWVLGIKVFDKGLWKKIEDGEINAFSIKGRGKRRKL